MPFHAGAQQGRGVALHKDIRMIRTVLLIALTASTLAACSENPPGTLAAHGRIPVAGGYSASERFEPAALSQEFHLAQLTRGAPQQPQAGPERHIAVTRSFTLRLPGSEVAAVQERHLAECA